GAAGSGGNIRHAHRPLPELPGMRDGVPVGRGVRENTGAGAGADRTEIQAAAGVADRTRRGVPPAAAVPESNCPSGAYAEVLPEVRDCRDRACDRNSAAAGAARARTIDAE